MSFWVVITVKEQGIILAICVSNYNDDDGSAIKEENRF